MDRPPTGLHSRLNLLFGECHLDFLFLLSKRVPALVQMHGLAVITPTHGLSPQLKAGFSRRPNRTLNQFTLMTALLFAPAGIPEDGATCSAGWTSDITPSVLPSVVATIWDITPAGPIVVCPQVLRHAATIGVRHWPPGLGTPLLALPGVSQPPFPLGLVLDNRCWCWRSWLVEQHVPDVIPSAVGL